MTFLAQLCLILDWIKEQFNRCKFLTEEEIVEDLLSDLISDEEQVVIGMSKYEDLIQYHNSLGRYIRNNYQLWDLGNPYIQLHDSKDPNHPDNMSYRIIQTVWKRVQGKVL